METGALCLQKEWSSREHENRAPVGEREGSRHLEVYDSLASNTLPNMNLCKHQEQKKMRSLGYINFGKFTKLVIGTLVPL